MKKVKQLSLFLDNKPGVLAKICAVLARKKVNILGIAVTDGHDHAVVRMVVDDPRRAMHLLGESGVLVVENDVLIVNVPNSSGTLGAISRRLGSGKVNIEYSYCTAAPDQKSAQLVLSVNPIKTAEKILKNLFKKR